MFIPKDDKYIYTGANVLRKYLNDSPLKEEWNGQSLFAITKEVLKAVEEAIQRDEIEKLMMSRNCYYCDDYGEYRDEDGRWFCWEHWEHLKSKSL